MFRSLRAAIALSIVAATFTAAPAQAGILQCVPFARQISGIQLFGMARDWWAKAAGKYERGSAPKQGAVLAFAASRSMPLGHVATVSKVLGQREVLLTHANWSYRGGVERNVRAIDVSPNNDWTQVKVWFAPLGGLGKRINPARGFIYGASADASAQAAAPASAQDQVAAAAGTVSVARL